MPELDQVDDVLDVPGACALLKVGKTALYAAAAGGKIPHRRVGRQIRFSRRALMRWLSSCSDEESAQGGP
jgi:excisionase family DNA binding protein